VIDDLAPIPPKPIFPALTAPTYRGGAKELSRIRADARQVENDKTLSAREKRQRLDALAVERNRVAADVDAEARAE
jgi:hypothetical protein